MKIVLLSIFFALCSAFPQVDGIPDTRAENILPYKDYYEDFLSRIDATETDASNRPNFEDRDVTCPFRMAKFVWQSMLPTFNENLLIMPAGRRKFNHSVGSMAGVRFEAIPNEIATGAFSKDVPHCLLRASLAKSAPPFFPSFGMVCYGATTTFPILASYGFDGQGEDYNFFARSATNVIPPPENPFIRFVKKFQLDLATKCSSWMSINKWLTTNLDGSAVQYPRTEATPKTPKVIFRVSEFMKDKMPREKHDFRDSLATIPANSHLYDVYLSTVSSSPHIDNEDWLVGRLWSNTVFKTSSFGDDDFFVPHLHAHVDGCSNEVNLLPNKADRV